MLAGIGGSPPVTIIPGTAIAFKGIADNAPGNIEAYNGTIMPLSLTMSASKESGGNITWSVPFGVMGELTYDAAVGAADSSYTLHSGSAAIADAAIIGGVPDPYPIPGFRSWTFTISASEKLYTVNGFRHRVTGNLTATISIDVFNSTLRNVKYDPNVLGKVKLFIDATTGWVFEWVKFRELTNYIINRETQEIIGYTINGSWTSVNSTLGHITRPSGTHLFGT
jgi:hypothetical protein